jgi:hypothetical protein
MKAVVFFRSLLVALAATIFCSCASVTVGGVDASNRAKPVGPPKQFYVAAFDVSRTDAREHPLRKNPGQLRQEAQKLIANYLVADLSRNIAPATLVSSSRNAGRDGWLVSGEITKLNEGSRFLRMAVGLGFGRTKMETRVQVQNLPASNPPFLRFGTKGSSGVMPGAATNPIPFSATPTALLQGPQGVSDDSARTARMITAAVADYMVERGWLAPGKVQRPKTR